MAAFLCDTPTRKWNKKVLALILPNWTCVPNFKTGVLLKGLTIASAKSYCGVAYSLKTNSHVPKYFIPEIILTSICPYEASCVSKLSWSISNNSACTSKLFLTLRHSLSLGLECFSKLIWRQMSNTKINRLNDLLCVEWMSNSDKLVLKTHS